LDFTAGKACRKIQKKENLLEFELFNNFGYLTVPMGTVKYPKLINPPIPILGAGLGMGALF
jgi:hypothetical protein